MTAKIGTQAPERICTWDNQTYEDGEVRVRGWTVSYPAGHPREYIRADVAAAREAAAAQAMREAAAEKVAATEPYTFRQPGSPNSYYTCPQRHDVHADNIRALPLPDPAALDRLIAERVREAFAALDECLEWMEQLRASGDAGFWEWQPGDAYNKGMALIARGRKEGRDGSL